MSVKTGKDQNDRQHALEQAVAPGAHAVLLLDRACGLETKPLAVPPKITLMPLPVRSPEINPVENLRLVLRDNWLSNRIFPSYDGILDQSCNAWNNLIGQP